MPSGYKELAQLAAMVATSGFVLGLIIWGLAKAYLKIRDYERKRRREIEDDRSQIVKPYIERAETAEQLAALKGQLLEECRRAYDEAIRRDLAQQARINELTQFNLGLQGELSGYRKEKRHEPQTPEDFDS